MRVAFACARSAPGVTTALLACASVWPRRALLVEAGEDGGALAARFGLGLEPGLTTLAAAVRREAGRDVLLGHSQSLPGTDGRLAALVGPATGESAGVLLTSAGRQLADLLAIVDDELDVLIDAGRLSTQPAAAPLVATADRLVLVARPRVEELQTLQQRLPALGELGAPLQLLLVGERPYGASEVAAALGCEVAGVLAHDPTAADALAGIGPARRLARRPLLRSATTVVAQLTGQQPAPGPPEVADRDVSPTMFAARQP